jgi:hypothetical protein
MVSFWGFLDLKTCQKSKIFFCKRLFEKNSTLKFYSLKLILTEKNHPDAICGSGDFEIFPNLISQYHTRK